MNSTNTTAILAGLVALALLGIVLIAAIGNDVPTSLEQALYTLIGGTVGGTGGVVAGVTIAHNDAKKKQAEAARLDALWRGGRPPGDKTP